MSRAAPTMKTEAVSPSPVFDKCYRYRDAERARQVRLYPFFRALDSGSDPEVTIEGLRMIMLGSNNYLGLANDPRVKEAAVAAVRKYGSSCAGSRLLNGTLDLHVRLEERLAEFVRQPAAVTFTTGYQVNLGTLSCLVGKGDTVYLDKLDQASQGKIKSELFQSGQLFADLNVTKALIQGQIDMAAPGTWTLTGLVPDSDFCQLPALYGPFRRISPLQRRRAGRTRRKAD